MNRYVVALLIMPILAATAHAQSWIDGQQAYHEKLNAEVELFQQRQEMERMRQDNEREMLEQQREIEQQRYELDRMRQQSASGRDNLSSLGPPSSHITTESLQVQQDMNGPQQLQTLKSQNEKSADESDLVLSAAHYQKNTRTLGNKGFSNSEAQRINELHKRFIYRIEKAATKGDADAQFKLGLIYNDGFIRHSSDRIKKVSASIQEVMGNPDLSTQDKHEVIIGSVEDTLDNGSDIVYAALCNTPSLPIVGHDKEKALELLNQARLQKHAGAIIALSAIRVMDDKNRAR